jgi:hypothetical protein
MVICLQLFSSCTICVHVVHCVSSAIGSNSLRSSLIIRGLQARLCKNKMSSSHNAAKEKCHYPTGSGNLGKFKMSSLKVRCASPYSGISSFSAHRCFLFKCHLRTPSGNPCLKPHYLFSRIDFVRFLFIMKHTKIIILTVKYYQF